MSRFILQNSELKENHFVCTDTENMIICTFENHKFNDTQEFKFLSEPTITNPTQLAKIAREMGDWLREEHYNSVF